MVFSKNKYVTVQSNHTMNNNLSLDGILHIKILLYGTGFLGILLYLTGSRTAAYNESSQ